MNSVITNHKIIDWSMAPSRENDLSAKTYNFIKQDLEKEF